MDKLKTKLLNSLNIFRNYNRLHKEALRKYGVGKIGEANFSEFSRQRIELNKEFAEIYGPLRRYFKEKRGEKSA